MNSVMNSPSRASLAETVKNEMLDELERRQKRERKKALKISLYGRTHSGPRKRRKRKKKKKNEPNAKVKTTSQKLSAESKVFLPKSFTAKELLVSAPESKQKYVPMKKYFLDSAQARNASLQSRLKIQRRESRLPLILAEDTASNAAISVLESGRNAAIRKVATEYVNDAVRIAYWETVWKTMGVFVQPYYKKKKR